jgi:hypothetical protein
MKSAFIVLTILSLTTQALAADRYQLIPLESSGFGKHQVHTALLADMNTGDTYTVTGNWTGENPPQVEVNIKKIDVDGESPPGRAELSPWVQNAPREPYGYQAIWKVNQSTGDVTLCNSPVGDFPPLRWACRTGHLP